MLKLAESEVDTHIAGIEPSPPVRTRYGVEGADEEVAYITDELLDGRVLKKTLFRTDEADTAASATTSRFAATDVKTDDPVGHFAEVVQNVIEDRAARNAGPDLRRHRREEPLRVRRQDGAHRTRERHDPELQDRRLRAGARPPMVNRNSR